MLLTAKMIEKISVLKQAKANNYSGSYFPVHFCFQTLDVDTVRAFRAACQSKRKIAAMAMLKSADRVRRTRAQTAFPKHLPQMNELSEVSELLMNLRQELKITEETDIVTVDKEAKPGTTQAGTSGQAAGLFLCPGMEC